MQKLFVHEVPKNLHVHAFINNRKPINTDELLMNFSKSIQPNKPAQPSVRLQAVSGNQYAGIKITDDQKLQKCHIHLSIIRRPPLAAAFMRPASLSRSWSVVLNAWHRGILERQWWQQKKAGTKSSKMVYQMPAKFATAAPVKDGGPGEDTQLLTATTSWGSWDW